MDFEILLSMQAIVDKMRSDFSALNIGVFGSKALLNRTSRFGPATLKDSRRKDRFEKHFLSVMSGVGSARVILSVCLSVCLSVPYCRTDINLRQLSFLKMFLVCHKLIIGRRQNKPIGLT